MEAEEDEEAAAEVVPPVDPALGASESTPPHAASSHKAAEPAYRGASRCFSERRGEVEMSFVFMMFIRSWPIVCRSTFKTLYAGQQMKSTR